MALDQDFLAYGSKLLTTDQPYDPAARVGDAGDDSYYLARPGVDFMRPWLAIQGDVAFQWPLGLQGFTLTTSPDLGTHHFVGDNKVVVDVIHTGAESITMAGSFLGDSAPSLVQALREVVRRVAPAGKILYIPEVMSHAQRVQVSNFVADRDRAGRGRAMSYTIDFWITGLAGKIATPTQPREPVVATSSARGTSGRTVHSDAAHNTLRKIAAWKLGSADDWARLYSLNEPWFNSHSIQKSKAPDYRLPAGTAVSY